MSLRFLTPFRVCLFASTFGGLVRVQNKSGEFFWVHEQFVDEY